jgi:WD40 repeat protein
MNLDVTKIKVVQSFVHERILTTCAFSPCGKFLVAGGQTESLVRWDLETQAKTTLAGHQSWIGAIAFQAEPKRLFSADFIGSIRAWSYDQTQPETLWALPEAHRGWVRALLVTPDGNLISTGNDRSIRIWSAENGQLVRQIDREGSYIFSLAFHPDGKSFVSGDLMGQVQQWEYASGKLLRTLDAKPLHSRGDDFLADVGGIRSLAFDRSGKLLACGGMTDAKSNTFCPGEPAVLVFDWSNGQLQRTLRTKHKSDGPVNALVFLPDGTLAGHAEHLNGASSLEFWQTDNVTPLHMMQRESGYCLSLHPSGQQLAAATFKNFGRGGNGRHSTPAEYTPHQGEVSILQLS